MLSSVSLGANTLPFPSLVPKEDWFAGGGGENKAFAKPSVAELISIMMETQPLAL